MPTRIAGRSGSTRELGLSRDRELHGVGRIAEREHEAVADLLDQLAVVLDEQPADDGVDPVERGGRRRRLR